MQLLVLFYVILNVKERMWQSMLRKMLIFPAVSFFFVLFFSQSGFANSAASIQVIWNFNSLADVAPVMKDNRVFLPLRKTADLTQSVTVWDQKSNTITIQRPETMITLKLNSKKAEINGNAVSFDAPPFVVKGVTYVPLRFTATAFGIDVDWDSKTSTVQVSTDSQLAFANLGSHFFWLDSRSGNVYSLDNGQPVLKLGTTDFQWEGVSLLHSTVTPVDSNTYFFNVTQMGGTTLAWRNHYQILIHHSKVVKHAKISFHDGLNDINQNLHNGKAVFREGSSVLFVNPDGTTDSCFDLGSLSGLEDNAFTVEAVFDDYFLARAHPYGTIWLVDRNATQTTALYKSLLTPEQQQWVDQWDKTDAMFQGDGLAFVKREGQELVFSFKEWWSGTEKIELTYKIPN